MSDLAAFERVTTGYYRAPDVADATRALTVWLALLDRAGEAEIASMFVVMFLFGRIAQTSPAARAAFAPIIAGYTGAHGELARTVVRVDGLPDVLAIPTDRPEILDLLWAEFFVTGSADPVRRIASALDAPDAVRAQLHAWLQAPTPRHAEIAAELAVVGIVVDLEGRVVVTEGDLDCLVFTIAEAQLPVFGMLPFELAPPAVLQLAVKGAAVWSLRLNAQAHPVVAATVREEAARPGGAARARLAS